MTNGLIYIIGGSGFIGKNLVRCYYRQYKILVVDKFIDVDYFKQYPKVETLKLDLAEELLPASYPTPDFIINLASIVTAERDLSLFDSLIASNLKILLNLYQRFSADEKLKLFIQFGSSEEYGSENSPFKETMRECPNSPYALIKQLTTNTAIMLYQNYRFPIMVVRPGNLFGPLQHNSKFIPYVIECLIENKPLNVSPCEQKRDFIYIDDFAFCIHKILQNYTQVKGEIVNVSSGESISLKEIIEFCKSELHSNSKINYGAIPYRENEVMDLKCSVDKIIEITNTEMKFDIMQRLKDYIN